MNKKMNLMQPVNNVEKKILKDKEFLAAISVGRPRSWHHEGTIENHIREILEFIQKNYRTSKYYEDLRILALLHDTGKFVQLQAHPEFFLPDMPEPERKVLFRINTGFVKKYSYELSSDIRKYLYTSRHTFVSYEFSKKFLKDKRLLEIIKYHDIAADMMHIEHSIGSYDTKFFKRIFSNLDIDLYSTFLRCDHCTRVDNIVEWFNSALKRNGFHKKLINKKAANKN